MNWDWKSAVKKNIFKILAHIGFEYTALAAWYIALEGDPIFWPIGIISAFSVHLLIFTKIDFLHEYHHHHNKGKGHANHIDNHLPNCKCTCYLKNSD